MAVADHSSGVIDTCVYIDLDVIDPSDLPLVPEITTVTLAELHQGVAMARDASARAARVEKLGAAVADFEALPFDAAAAARYGSLVALTVAASQNPRPRRLDLMIAAVASTRKLPLYTRNPEDFKAVHSAVEIIPV